MSFDIIYWDETAQEQRTRQSTPEEDAQREADIAAANTPVLADAIPMLNLHLVLIEDGHLTNVQQIIGAMEGDAGLRARAYWDKALTARRDNPLVNQLWPVLYLDEAAFNTAWARAAALNP